ncbi:MULTISPECIES: YbaK/EbsC family protein [Shewanella]|uniref:YbaK/EbsC family protein n=1 Tax=Shewanella TaxID=22 RepID=UPI0005A2EF3D|nr:MULTISPECIES: YbaK/EbsC family protein [Shewanella]KIO38182.1 prolyl-tRNA synthetase [Shewanella sp. cp20]MCG9721119.1 YbaK/EbsC family protein [Shewanella sp. Isolate7]MCG9747683.1 YbaK/EbsC family protein [Shewanella sp. Isolate8]MCL2909006.1 YbaK/EbsC family protein [Shewanella aquimarina]
MSISNRLNHYLAEHEVNYEIVLHRHSHNSISSAIAAQLAPAQVAKGVILEDHQGRRIMAVLPTNHKINLKALGDKLNRDLHLVKEQTVYQMFDDCEHGAIPSLGAAYNIETIYDDLLIEAKELYLEAGDHTSLVRLSREDFIKLIKDAKHLRFSYQSIH